MQPQDTHFAGVITNNTFYANRTVSTVTPSISGRKVVECGSVVPGNKHDPLPWKYRIFNQHGPSGLWESKGVEYYMMGSPVWYTAVSQGDVWYSLNGRMPQKGADNASIAYNKALKKLYDKIRTSKLDLAVSVGESKQTYRMFKAVVDGAIGVKQSLKALIRNNGIAGASRKLSAGWLGYAYGVRPLVSDVQAMLGHIASNPSVLDVTTKARASVSETFNDLIDDPLYGHEKAVRQVVTDSRRCQIGVVWTPSEYRLNELHRIMSLFPPTLMWELTTLSFAVDWFVDVGSYLANLEASFGSGLTFKTGYVTHSRRIQLSQTCSLEKEPIVSDQRSATRAIWTCTAEEKALERTLLTSFPRPTLPNLKVPTGASQLLSLAALLRTIGLKKY